MNWKMRLKKLNGLKILDYVGVIRGSNVQNHQSAMDWSMVFSIPFEKVKAWEMGVDIAAIMNLLFKNLRSDYEILVDTDENDHRLALIHNNVKKYATVYNTVALGTTLSGVLRRRDLPQHERIPST